MNIYFIDPEPSEQAFLQAALADHTLHFSTQIDDVPTEAEILSVFINARIDSAFLEAHPALRFVAARSSTVDHIDREACARRGIVVSYVPTYGNQTVAEHTFALILALTRRLREAMESLRRPYFSYDDLRGIELRGKTLGVIGTGRIGREVLRLGRAFGMKALARDIAPSKSAAQRLGFRYVPLSELLHKSHVLSLHTALTPKTRHLLDQDAFAQCRRGVLVINTARGALIDTEALIAAMDAGIVGGVGLDVLEDERVMRGGSTRVISSEIIDRLHASFRPAEPRAADPQRVHDLKNLVYNEALLSRPNVVFTPHIAFNSEEAIECINRTTAENIKAFLLGRPVNVLGDSLTRSRRARTAAPLQNNRDADARV